MSSEFVSHQLQPPIYHIGKNVAVNNEKEEDQVDPKLGMKDQELIIKKSVTRGFVLSLMIAGLYIYQKVIRKHYKGHTPQTFFLLFLAAAEVEPGVRVCVGTAATPVQGQSCLLSNFIHHVLVYTAQQ